MSFNNVATIVAFETLLYYFRGLSPSATRMPPRCGFTEGCYLTEGFHPWLQECRHDVAILRGILLPRVVTLGYKNAAAMLLWIL